jgi:hypothetical protein
MVVPALAQKQVIFILHGDVVARYSEGEIFKCKLKNGQKKSGFIIELNEFSMITSSDTIEFRSIAKIKGIPQPKWKQRVGGLMMIVGFGYVALDQLNVALGYNPPGFDDADWNAVKLGAVGALVLLIKPQFQRIRPGTSIRTIDYHSPFYLFK